MDSFQLFNQLWAEKKIKKPLVILIGGYCGTGKSTLAKELHNKILESTIVPTGIVRSACKPFLNKMGEIYSSHTYGLYRFSKSDEELFENYKRQSEILFEPIKEICSFAKTEMQNLIIDGNHVFPELKDRISDSWCIDVFMKSSDSAKLIENMTGITHPRVMNQEEITTAEKLHQLTVKEISKVQPMFEFNQQEKAIEYVEKQLSTILEENGYPNLLKEIVSV